MTRPLESDASSSPALANGDVASPRANIRAETAFRRRACRFDVLLASALAHPRVVHIVGDGPSFRQAIAAPVAANRDGSQEISGRKGHLLNLLIERTNGEVLFLRLLDHIADRLDLKSFMQKFEAALANCVDADMHEIEAVVARSMGCAVTVDEVSLNPGAASYYANAIPELAASVVAEISSRSKSANAPAITMARCRVSDELNRQRDSALDNFCRRLDSRIVTAVLRSGDLLTSTRYNRYRRLGSTIRHRRLQAAEAFPLIGTLLIDDNKRYSFLRRAVDRKLPLTPAVSKVLKAPQEVIRWLMGKDIACVGPTWVGRLGELTDCLAKLCPEHRPRAPEDWAVFAEFVAAIRKLDTRTQGSPRISMVSAMDGLLGQVGRMGWPCGRTRVEAAGTGIGDLEDMADLIDEIVQVLADQIGEGGALGEVLVDELVPSMKKLYLSIGIVRQLQASRLWHQLMLAAEEPTVEHPSLPSVSLNSWPAPFHGALNIDGLVAVCLTNPQQLKNEGVHMQHCVGNYAAHCLYYGSTIVSFRRPDECRVSTAELHLSGNHLSSLRFQIRQHRGPKNTAPPAEAANALKKLLTMLNGAELAERRHIQYQALQERKVLQRDHSSRSADPVRAERLRQALKVHLGYERFHAEAWRVAQER